MQSIWMLTSTLLFSLMGVLIKFVSPDYSVAEIVIFRSLVGTTMLGILMVWRGISFKTHFPTMHLQRGFLGVLAFWLLCFSLSYLRLATAMTLSYMSPIWAAAIMFAIGIWSGQRELDWKLVTAVLAGFVGVALILRPAFYADELVWGFMGLMSGVLCAIGYLQLHQLGKMGEPSERVALYFCVTGILGGVIALAFEPKLLAQQSMLRYFHNTKGLMLLLGIGITGTIGQLAIARAFRSGKTMIAANLEYTGILFSSFFGYFFWNETFGWPGWLGVAIITASGISTTLLDEGHKPFFKFHHPKS